MDGIGAVLQQNFAAIIAPFLVLGVGLATATLVILSLAAAIRGVLLILETLLDNKSTSELLAQLARGGVIVLLFMVALAGWSSIQGFVLGVTSGASNSVASAMGIDRPPVFAIPYDIAPEPRLMAQQVSSGVLSSSMEQLMMTLYRVERLYRLRMLIAGLADATQQTPPPGVNLDQWIEEQITLLEQQEESRSLSDRLLGYTNAILPMLQNGLIYAGAILSVLAFAVVIFYYLLGSLITILVGLGLGPVAVAVAPIESAFLRNLGALLLSSAMQFAVVSNLGVLLAAAINEMAIYYLQNAQLGAGFGGTMMDFALSTFLIPVLCIVFALLVPKILGAITEIFSGGGSAKPGGVMKYIGMAMAATKLGAIGRMVGLGGGARAAGAAAGGAARGVSRAGSGSLPKP